MRIEPGNIRDPAVVALLRTHFATMHATSPEESCHVLPVEAMTDRADLYLFAAWTAGGALAGVGAFQNLGKGQGEIKSMHTAESERRRGTGQAILDRLIAEARERGITHLWLETGSAEAFAPARALYRRNGFALCPPFGSYREDPNSVFMTRAIQPAQ